MLILRCSLQHLYRGMIDVRSLQIANVWSVWILDIANAIPTIFSLKLKFAYAQFIQPWTHAPFVFCLILCRITQMWQRYSRKPWSRSRIKLIFYFIDSVSKIFNKWSFIIFTILPSNFLQFSLTDSPCIFFQ